MTEAQWLGCDEPDRMLAFLRDKTSDRKLRLFAVACARDELARAQAGQGCFNFGDELDAGFTEFFWDPARGYEAAVLAAESAADGGPQRHFSPWYVGHAVAAEAIAYAALGHDPDGLTATPPERIAETARRYTNHPAGCLRDIFGNPFRPAAVDPGWLTHTVMSLARTAYEERTLPSGELDPQRLAVLADALEEAGCSDPELMGHLRSAGPHVRGCWALDLVLGKQ